MVISPKVTLQKQKPKDNSHQNLVVNLPQVTVQKNKPETNSLYYTGNSLDEIMNKLNISALQNAYFVENRSVEKKFQGTEEGFTFLNKLKFLGKRIVSKDRVIQYLGMDEDGKKQLLQDIWDDCEEHHIVSNLTVQYDKNLNKLNWCNEKRRNMSNKRS